MQEQEKNYGFHAAPVLEGEARPALHSDLYAIAFNCAPATPDDQIILYRSNVPGRDREIMRLSRNEVGRRLLSHQALVEALKLARDALRTHDPEWDYMRAIRAALSLATEN